MRGTVTSFSPSHGYGFITTQKGKDVYFHVKDCEFKPMIGDPVEFMWMVSEKGFKATRVRKEIKDGKN